MIDVVQDPRNIKSNYHCKVDFIIAEYLQLTKVPLKFCKSL